MKVIELSRRGVASALPKMVEGVSGRYYAFEHGEEGRGRWAYRLPLSARAFPPRTPPQLAAVHSDGWAASKCPVCEAESLLRPGDFCSRCSSASHLAGVEFSLRALGRRDARGNALYVLEPGQADGSVLVLWRLDPGFRGGASYRVEGAATVLAEGEQAQGAAGRMGGAPCPVVLVSGPCHLFWERTGRLYGTPAKWLAVYDGARWTVGPEEQVGLEAEVFA